MKKTYHKKVTYTFEKSIIDIIEKEVWLKILKSKLYPQYIKMVMRWWLMSITRIIQTTY